MKRILFSTLLVLLLSACGPAATPEPTADIAATLNAISGTMVAGTLTARPTATALPTATASETPTIPAIETATPVATATETPLPPTETLTPTPWIGTLDPLGAANGRTGTFLIENNSGEPEIIVSFYGMTSGGNSKPLYLAYRVQRRFVFEMPWGSYNYTVAIGDRKTFTGTVGINNWDKTTMRVSMQKIVVVGP